MGPRSEVLRLAAVLLLVGACGAGDERGADDAVLPPESSLLVPSEPPPGWTIRAIAEIDRSREEGQLADPVVMYARSPDPERGTAAIFASVRPAEEVSGADASARVRGKPAIVDVTPPYQDVYAAPSLTWTEERGQAVVVWGVHVTRAEVAAMAEHIGVDRMGRPVAEDVPDGYVEVGSLEPGWRNETGVGVTLAPTDRSTDLRTVRIRRADPESVRVLRALVKDDPDDAYSDVELSTFESDLGRAEELRVLGQSAVAGRISPLTRALVIEGEPGVVLLAEGDDDYPDPLTTAELVALAERLEATAPGRFEERLERAYRAEGDRRREELYDAGFGQPAWQRSEEDWVRSLHLTEYNFRSQAAGPGSDGEPVACLIETPESLNYAEQNDLGNLACAPRSDPDLAATSLVGDGPSDGEEVWGIVSDNVAGVLVELPTGSHERPRLLSADATNVRLFVVPLPAELDLVLPRCTPPSALRAQGISVVALDASGAEIARVETDASGRFPRQVPC